MSKFLILLFFITANHLIAKQNYHILHTNDWQSCLDGFKAKDANSYATGGVAHLATLIKQKRQQIKEPLLVLDAGDFSMGTLFHTVTRETGSELVLLQMLGYDAVALGNHEFDYRPDGLAKMIRSALDKTGKLPPLLATNIVFSKNDTKDQGLKELMKEGVIKRFHIINRGGLKFGIIGIMGKEAAEVASNKTPISFSDPITTATKYAKILKKKYGADIVIALSHGGVKKNSDNSWQGDDLKLASHVPEIDLVIGGHSHTALFEPLFGGSTPVLQAGSETKYLGEVVMSYHKQKNHLLEYKLQAIDERIKPDEQIATVINNIKKTVEEKVLSPYGYKFDQPLALLSKNFYRTLNDHMIGYLVTSAIKKASFSQVGFIANGSLRNNLIVGTSGIQTVSDLFSIVPLGIGEHDDSVGYPLIRIYITARELKNIVEVLLFAYKVRNNDYYPRFSGLKFRYSPYRVPLDQVYEISINDKKINLNDNSTLYSIGTTAYLGKFMWLIEEMSMGLFTVKPKNINGEVFNDLKRAIITQKTSTNKSKEKKLWAAFLQYIQQLAPNNNQLATISVATIKPYNPIQADNRLYLSSLFINLSWISYLVYALGVISLIVVLMTSKWLWQKRKKKKLKLSTVSS